jgi:signal transduction histidine kinase
MLDRLEDAFRRINQFTTDASHELRTPLTIIDIIAKERLAQSQTPKEYQQALAVIQAENDHMIRMVKRLLTLSRADNRQLRLYKEVVDLSDITLDAVERLFLLAKKQGIVLSVNALPELIMSGDRVYLTSMLTNLIENAIKYTSGVGDTVHIETGITHAEQGKKSWIRVEDNGPGIATEHLPYLFDRFYRVDKARSRRSEDEAGEMSEASGCGLGLSIVAWVAQAHGGDIHVQSEVGRGSVFEICFPLHKQCSGE